MVRNSVIRKPPGASRENEGSAENHHIYLADGENLKGTYRGADKASIFLRVKSDKSVQISRQDILRITTRAWGRGARLGLGIGAGTGAIIGAAIPAKSRRDFARGEMATAWMGLAGTVGFLVGAGVGTQHTIFNREIAPDLAKTAK